jgi:hypothetical protein
LLKLPLMPISLAASFDVVSLVVAVALELELLQLVKIILIKKAMIENEVKNFFIIEMMFVCD